VEESTKGDTLKTFLEDLMQRHKLRPNGLAADLGVSHATVGRWLSGDDIPNPYSCRKLSEYSGVPLRKVLSIAGHLPKTQEKAPAEWPEFREYALRKYPGELDEDLVLTIENLIESRRQKTHADTHMSTVQIRL
jgi:transcriptional regulator with XRE-family HTH domain